MQRQALINWQMVPQTGWGNYGIQLAQYLVSREVAFPVTPFVPSLSPSCDFQWRELAAEITFESLKYRQLVEGGFPPTRVECEYVFNAQGNALEERLFVGKYNIAIIFFEHTLLDVGLLEGLADFDLVVAGSSWNSSLLMRNGLSNVIRIIQGVDLSKFNSVSVPKVIKRPFVIYSGGKLELRKGQDIIISAFREFLKVCPDALLVACWINSGNSFGGISLSPYVEGAPDDGTAPAILEWLLQQGIPARNLLIPGWLTACHLPGLIKQADVAIFPNRCEGGTNLVAMEAIACGVPAILSANTGHLDLLRLGFSGVEAVGVDGIGNVPQAVSSLYGNGDPLGFWGEVDPDELLQAMIVAYEAKEESCKFGAQCLLDRHQVLGWGNTMDKLFAAIRSV
tara:strand:- start:132 stop:1319 length:1188 start_codon:yes stop_codon:yes gene_type:complete